MQVVIGTDDYKLLSGMGSGAEKGLAAAGIETFAQAQEACRVISTLSSASGGEYDVDQLICFLCLSQNKENNNVDGSPFPPAPAPPINLLDDLGWDFQVIAPVNICSLLRPPLRLHSKTCATLSSSFAMSIAAITVLPFLASGSAGSMFACSKSFHGLGFQDPAHRRYRFKINTGSLLDAAFNRHLRQWKQSGLPFGSLLRVLGCAFHMLEECAMMHTDSELLATVLLRLGGKHELASDEQKPFLDSLRLVDHQRQEAVINLEFRVTQKVWGAMASST